MNQAPEFSEGCFEGEVIYCVSERKSYRDKSLQKAWSCTHERRLCRLAGVCRENTEGPP